MKVLLLTLAAVALLATACGSSKKSASTAPLPQVLPAARTADEWASRVVNRFLRPLNKDLQVVNGFGNPDIVVYIANQNPTTLRIVNTRLADLAECSQKLVAIGPPPASRPALRGVARHFRKACTSYDLLARQLQKATLYLSSGRSDVISRGRQVLRASRPVGNAAAKEFVNGLRIAQGLPEFRRAGLQPSV